MDSEYSDMLDTIRFGPPFLSENERAEAKMEVTKGDDYLCQVRLETECENLEELKESLDLGTIFVQLMGILVRAS